MDISGVKALPRDSTLARFTLGKSLSRIKLKNHWFYE